MNFFSLKSLLSVLLIYISVIVFPAPVQAITIAGSNCAPATLGQALNLGFTTNQFGVSNPGTSPFFVVCPLHFEDDETYNFVLVGMEYTSASGGTTNCVIRLATASNSSLNAVPLQVSSGSAGYSQGSVGITINTIFQTNPTIVCPIFPGETLIWYALDD